MNKLEILNCIHHYCLDCSDDSMAAVEACEASGCDLYPFRMGEGVAEDITLGEALEAVRECCGICEDFDGTCLYPGCELSGVTS